jgi:hypothetical protein
MRRLEAAGNALADIAEAAAASESHRGDRHLCPIHAAMMSQVAERDLREKAQIIGIPAASMKATPDSKPPRDGAA